MYFYEHGCAKLQLAALDWRFLPGTWEPKWHCSVA